MVSRADYRKVKRGQLISMRERVEMTGLNHISPISASDGNDEQVIG